jgi:hypothetical protein
MGMRKKILASLLIAAGLASGAFGQLIAGEDFNYVTGDNITTVTNGTGWLDLWSGSRTVISNSLEYVGLQSSGNRISGGNNAISRNWNGYTYTNDSDVVWFSIRVNMNPVGDDGGGADDVRISPFGPNGGALASSTYIGVRSYGDGTENPETISIVNMGSGSSAPGFTAGVNNLVVGQITFSDTSGADILNVWLNPDVSSFNGTGATLSETGDFTLAGEEFSVRGTSGSQYNLDEIRVGESYAGVLPAGAVTAPTAPTTPTGLATTNEGPATIDLVWDANTEPDLSGYIIYRGDSAVSATNLLTYCSATATGYTDSGLEEAITYYYVIQAFDVFAQFSTVSDEVFSSPVSVGDLVAGDSFESDYVDNTTLSSISAVDLTSYGIWAGANLYASLFGPGVSYVNHNNIGYSGLLSAGGSAYYNNNAVARYWGATGYDDDGDSVWFSFTIKMGTDGDAGGADNLQVNFFSSIDSANPEGTELQIENDGNWSISGMGGTVSGTVTDSSFSNLVVHLVIGQIVFSDTANSDVFKVWLDPELTSFDGTQATHLNAQGDFDVQGDYMAWRANSGCRGNIDEIRIGNTSVAVCPIADASTPVISMIVSGGSLELNTTSLSSFATYNVQEKDDLVSGVWSNLYTITGVTATNIVLPQDKPKNNFRMVAE